jgi:hypothetical protein
MLTTSVQDNIFPLYAVRQRIILLITSLSKNLLQKNMRLWCNAVDFSCEHITIENIKTNVSISIEN